ncbi:MAG: SDR family oxidoreductase [Bauldia sp.]|nr:SDR family oxidoreductase [Bauldia sp.]
MTQPSFTLALPETVVVSGAASGLGLGVCRHLAASGVKTVGVDVTGAAEDLAAAPGYTHVKGDVSDEATWQSVTTLPEVKNAATLGIVASAAILDVGDIVDLDKALFERTLRVNVVGTALALKALIPVMVALGGGTIVAIGSVAATFAEQQLATYAASKGAVRQLARTVAMDHARNGIRINVLSPGPMMAGLFEKHLKSAADPEKFLAVRSQRQPGGEILSPDDVAMAAMFLLSPASNAVNGAELMADGGLTTSFDFRTGAEGASI